MQNNNINLSIFKISSHSSLTDSFDLMWKSKATTIKLKRLIISDTMLDTANPSINTKKTNFSQIWSQQLTSHTLRRMCTISQPRCSVYLMWISVSHLFDCLNNTNQNIIRRHVLPFRHWLQRSSLRVENKSVVFFLTVAIAICENVQSRFSRPVSRYTFTDKCNVRKICLACLSDYL